MTQTPRFTIKLTTAKNGQLRATYWSMLAMRWFAMPRAKAELLLATDQADAYVPYSAA